LLTGGPRPRDLLGRGPTAFATNAHQKAFGRRPSRAPRISSGGLSGEVACSHRAGFIGAEKTVDGACEAAQAHRATFVEQTRGSGLSTCRNDAAAQLRRLTGRRNEPQPPAKRQARNDPNNECRQASVANSRSLASRVAGGAPDGVRGTKTKDVVWWIGEGAQLTSHDFAFAPGGRVGRFRWARAPLSVLDGQRSG